MVVRDWEFLKTVGEWGEREKKEERFGFRERREKEQRAATFLFLLPSIANQ